MTDKSIARRAGRALEHFPQLHALAKTAYFHLNWQLRPERSIMSTTVPGYEILSPAAWAGTPEPPGENFFGYYDKSPWSPDGTQFLLHALAHARQSGEISILVLDVHARTCQEIARSSAWNYQQGSMIQWIRWRGRVAVAFNDLVSGRPVTRILSPEGANLAELDRPIQCSTADGRFIASISVARLSAFRPEYGYERLRNAPLHSIDHDGLFLLDTSTETWSLRLTLRQLIEHASLPEFSVSAHWLNHVAFAPDGGPLVFLHRWGDSRRQKSRLYAVDLETGAPNLLLDGGLVSHYCWLDAHTLLCYCESAAGYRYHVIDVREQFVRPVAAPSIAGLTDGHPSFCPKTGLVITDTYPNKHGRQQLILMERDLQTARTVATITHPPGFRGSTRCDLHPRWHPDGDAASFDSVMNGSRRSWILRRINHDK